MDFYKKWFSKSKEIQLVGFEDMKYAIQYQYMIINTLAIMEQECVIKGTMQYDKEEHIINKCMETNDKEGIIIIYGKNSADYTVYEKYNQLTKHGFYNVHIYSGGLFEWLLLQDIYGYQEFPTMGKCQDMLKYRATVSLQKHKLLCITGK
jgi:hypothetical protein